MDTLKLASKKEKRRGPGLILSANVDEEAISGPCNQCVQLHSALQQYVECSLAVSDSLCISSGLLGGKTLGIVVAQKSVGAELGPHVG